MTKPSKHFTRCKSFDYLTCTISEFLKITKFTVYFDELTYVFYFSSNKWVSLFSITLKLVAVCTLNILIQLKAVNKIYILEKQNSFR